MSLLLAALIVGGVYLLFGTFKAGIAMLVCALVILAGDI
jgi:hypothetical protein